MQLYKVRQRLGAVPPDPHILDLQPVETPFKKSWVRPCVCNHNGIYGVTSDHQWSKDANMITYHHL